MAIVVTAAGVGADDNVGDGAVAVQPPSANNRLINAAIKQLLNTNCLMIDL